MAGMTPSIMADPCPIGGNNQFFGTMTSVMSSNDSVTAVGSNYLGLPTDNNDNRPEGITGSGLYVGIRPCPFSDEIE